MLEAEKIEFNEYGQWLHSAIAAEEKEDFPISEYECSKGMEFSCVVLDDEIWEAADGPVDLSKWKPDPPPGDGWFVVAMTENEDCAFAMFARPEVK